MSPQTPHYHHSVVTPAAAVEEERDSGHLTHLPPEMLNRGYRQDLYQQNGSSGISPVESNGVVHQSLEGNTMEEVEEVEVELEETPKATVQHIDLSHLYHPSRVKML